MLAVFACADGRLLHSTDFAPALRSTLLDDARQLGGVLKKSQGPRFWTMRRSWLVEWLDERMQAGYSTPYRNTIYQSTVAIMEKERLFAGEPEPEPTAAEVAGRGEPGPALERRSEYAHVRELIASNLDREDTKRVMDFVDRIARERGWALSGLMKAREATTLGLDMFVDNARSHLESDAEAARRALASATPAPPALPASRPEPTRPQPAADRSRGAQRSGPA